MGLIHSVAIDDGVYGSYAPSSRATECMRLWLVLLADIHVHVHVQWIVPLFARASVVQPLWYTAGTRNPTEAAN